MQLSVPKDAYRLVLDDGKKDGYSNSNDNDIVGANVTSKTDIEANTGLFTREEEEDYTKDGEEYSAANDNRRENIVHENKNEYDIDGDDAIARVTPSLNRGMRRTKCVYIEESPQPRGGICPNQISSTVDQHGNTKKMPWFAILTLLVIVLMFVAGTKELLTLPPIENEGNGADYTAFDVAVMAYLLLACLVPLGYVVIEISNCCKIDRTGGVGKKCCTHVGASIILLLGAFGIFMAIYSEESLLYGGGGTLLIALPLLFCWMRNKCNRRADPGQDSINAVPFWQRYWVALFTFFGCLILSTSIFDGLILSVSDSSVDFYSNHYYFWFVTVVGNRCLVIVAYILRMVRWRHPNNGTDKRIYYFDICCHLFGFTLIIPTVILIDYVDLWIFLVSIFAIAVATIAVFWCIIYSKNTPTTAIASTNGSKNEGTKTYRREKYPEDTFSFLAYYGARQNPNFFSFGLLIFIFQSTLLLLLVLSVVEPRLKTAEIDNPSEHRLGFFPSKTSKLLQATQIVALLGYLFFPDASISDILESFKLFPPMVEVFSGREEKTRRLALSCTLRITQGILVFLSVFFLVMTSENVIDVVLNFTAVEFLSQVDNRAFELAEKGFYGRDIRSAIQELKQAVIPQKSLPDLEQKQKRNRIGIVGTSTLLIFLMAAVMYAQYSDDVWTTGIVRVQFDGVMSIYNGCYNIDVGAQYSRHYVYNGNERNAKLGYCKKKRRWIFFTKFDDPCDAYGTEEEIAHSVKTDTFDIKASTTENWFTRVNTPMDLYFIDEDDEATLNESCDSFLDDGKCDKLLNNFAFQYDGGDCCAATCNNPTCGEIDENIRMFPHCQDPSMVPITVYFYYENYNNTEWVDGISLKLDCGSANDAVNVFTIPLDGFIESYASSEPAMVPGDSSCSCYATKKGVATVDQDYPEIQYIIYHGYNAGVIGYETFIIHESSISDNTTNQNFMIPSFGYFTKQNHMTRHIGMLSDLETLDLSQSNVKGTIPSEIGKLGNLTRLDLSDNDIEGTFPSEIWLLTKLKMLNVTNNTISGSIPSEIGLLASLQHLGVDGNDFKGSIPSEIGLLTSLQYLALDINDIVEDRPTGAAPIATGSIPSEIGFLTSLQYLSLNGNANSTRSSVIIGTIPSEIGLLTGLQHLCLNYTDIQGNIPSEIGLLTRMEYLSLYDNEIEGTIPSEIWLLTSSQHLSLGNNHALKGTIPSEIGLLTSLQHLEVDDNDLTGSIPSEIGLLASLQYLALYNNDITGTIPSEIGLLTSLKYLDLHHNQLTGTVPSEIESLQNLNCHLYGNDFTGDIPSHCDYWW